MKLRNPFAALTRFELFLWIFSLVVILISMFLLPQRSALSISASLIGVTALIFISKGDVFGQALCLIFALLYAAVSYTFSYWGEMITYLGMSAPAALISLIAWLKHPYKKGEVRAAKLTSRSIVEMIFFSVSVTVVFYFVLRALDTPNMFFSTLSIMTSFAASYMTFKRSPFYGLAYAANDIVLIIMWILASIENPAYISTGLCFVMFFANDIYGFINWRKIKKRQETFYD